MHSPGVRRKVDPCVPARQGRFQGGFLGAMSSHVPLKASCGKAASGAGQAHLQWLQGDQENESVGGQHTTRRRLGGASGWSSVAVPI